MPTVGAMNYPLADNSRHRFVVRCAVKEEMVVRWVVKEEMELTGIHSQHLQPARTKVRC